MSHENTPLIEVRGIKKIYQLEDIKLEILRGIDLEIRQGEFVAIMGPSGSGKSTLMHILGLLDKPSSGEYRISGKDVLSLSDSELAFLRSKTIGFVFQQFNLLSRVSAAENVALPMIYSKMPGRHERSVELLNEVGLGDRVHHRPNQLSGGQQQRVAIARSLVNNPRIIFADEPTGNLASAQAEEIMGILRKLNQSGITVVMVTHEPDIAAFADRIIHIKDGLVHSDKTSDEIAAKQAHSASGIGSGQSGFTMAEFGEHFMSAFRSMLSNKTRTFLTMLGVIIGVGAIIAMLALGRGAQKSVEERLSSLGSNLLMLMPGNRSRSGGVHISSQSQLLTEDDAAAIAADKNLIGRIDPNIMRQAAIIYGNKNSNTQVVGATPEFAVLRNLVPVYGRSFTQSENENLEKVAVIGQTVANNLFDQQNPVGQRIKIEKKTFTVLGVLPLKGASRFNDQDDIVIIPLKTAMKRVFGEKYLHMIWIQPPSPEKLNEAKDYVRLVMRRQHRLAEDKEDDFNLMNMSDIQQAVASTTKTFGLLLGIIAGISLLVGGIGIMNIMLVSVTERTREIGLRKAIGATSFAIMAQFLIEASVLSLVGGLIGVLLGSSAAIAISKFAGWAVVVSPMSIFLSVGFSAFVGIVFGFWPARKASLLSPIEALRYE